jgi:hypothetical protein
VRDVGEAEILCGFLRGKVSAEAVMERLEEATSPGFDPVRDLERIGLANQTTMLMTETLAVQELLRAAMRDRYGQDALASRFSAFDTICSATQDRQDAVTAMLKTGGLDLMVVIGGYNSSNTQALAQMCAPRMPTFHIDVPGCIEENGIRHRPVRQYGEIRVVRAIRGPAPPGCRCPSGAQSTAPARRRWPARAPPGATNPVTRPPPEQGVPSATVLHEGSAPLPYSHADAAGDG